MEQDIDQDLAWLSAPRSRFSKWLRRGMLRLGATRATVVTSMVAVLLSLCVSLLSHVIAGLPTDQYPRTLMMGTAIPAIVAPPITFFVVRFMFEAETARRIAHQLSVTDPLTQAFNRRHFFQVGAQRLAEGLDAERPMSVLLVDVDHFKSVNDVHGHGIGDEVLKQVVLACRAGLRSEDLLARLGGEEFALLLPGLSKDAACQVAERLRQNIESVEVGTGTQARVETTVSIGVATAQTRGTTLDALLQRADAAMYRAKKNGRNRVVAQDTAPLEA